MALDLDDLIVAPDTPLLEALKRLDQTGLEVVLVCDGQKKLVGVCTDGDFRRSLIHSQSVSGCVADCMNTQFTVVSADASRADCLQMMLKDGYNCLPVVDKKGVLVDLHTLRTSISTSRKPNWAVVMAGGFGTRLGELTKGVPKPMLPIGDRPILAHIVTHLVSHGIERIFLSVNYLGSQVQEYFGDGRNFSCEIDYLIEDEPLGTGGSLSLLPEIPKEPLLVMNGDLLTRINVSRLLAFHRAGEFDATICLREHVVKVPFGVAEVSGGMITQLKEKPSLDYRINAGIYVINPMLMQQIPAKQFFPITELFNNCLDKKGRLGGYHMQEDWIDVGLPDEFVNAQEQAKT